MAFSKNCFDHVSQKGTTRYQHTSAEGSKISSIFRGEEGEGLTGSPRNRQKIAKVEKSKINFFLTCHFTRLTQFSKYDIGMTSVRLNFRFRTTF